MPELPRNETAASGLPALRLLQGPRRARQIGLTLLYSSRVPSRNWRSVNPMITIAVDAMGGDHAPRPEVEGSVLAARELGVRVLLVGQPNVVRLELARHASPNLPIEIVPAGEVITMQDHPAQAFRRKKDSSVHVAARLVREAKADGMVSAGNTGAVMTVAKFLLGTLESVDRVALAAPFPNAKGGVSVLLDVGANVDSKPEHLVQFAVMGEVYYRATFGNRRPRVGLLSIGEEEIKGNELTREVHTDRKSTRLNSSHMSSSYAVF